MHPLSDINPRQQMPHITFSMIAINALVFIWILIFPTEQDLDVVIPFSITPGHISQDPIVLDFLLDFLRNMFFQVGLMHLLGSMLYLYLFGENVEDRMRASSIYFAMFSPVLKLRQLKITLIPSPTFHSAGRAAL